MTNTVIITGASQGIGKATALEFAHHGYEVVLAARQLDRLEAAASEVRSLGRKALAISTDVRDPVQVKHLVHTAIIEKICMGALKIFRTRHIRQMFVE